MQEPPRERVLIVEDETESRDALAELLRESGFEVAVAGDGQEGVDLAKTFHPGVILMDFGLPEVNGWEATLRLRRDPQTVRIPIVAVTGQERPEALLLAQEVGCLEVLAKPVDPDWLVARLREISSNPHLVETLPQLPEEGC